MDITKPVPLAAQAAAILGVPSNTVCVTVEDGVVTKVEVGVNVKGVWTPKGDVPAGKQAAISAWAEKQNRK